MKRIFKLISAIITIAVVIFLVPKHAGGSFPDQEPGPIAGLTPHGHD